jgi:sec-independent protein translocase protein TatB
MLGIGFLEVVIIFIVGIIVVGPKQLPMVIRKVAGFYRQIVELKEELSFQILNAENEKESHKNELSSLKPHEKRADSEGKIDG